MCDIMTPDDCLELMEVVFLEYGRGKPIEFGRKTTNEFLL